MDEVLLRIGELSRRVGVSPELLRAWERRYGLLQPTRTSGGFRLYSEADVARVQRMQQLLDEGLAASEAARLASTTPPETDVPEVEGSALEGQRAQLAAALDGYDEAQAHALLDRALAVFQLETVLSELLVPYLHDLGDRWERGEVTVAQEHFGSNLIRGRLFALAQGWDRGVGPRAILACPPGEQHDLPLVMFGLALRRHGWRVVYLGAQTPIDGVASTAELLSPELIVLAATDQAHFEGVVDDVSALARRWKVMMAGAGATDDLAEEVVAERLNGDLVEAAAQVASAA